MKNNYAKAALLLVALFIGSCALLLWREGRLSPDKWRRGTKPSTASQAIKSNLSKPPGQIVFTLPSPFSFEEISQLTQSLAASKREYETKLKELQQEREELVRIRQDVEERQQAVAVMMQKISVMAKNIEAQRKIQPTEKSSVETDDELRLKKMAKLFAGMDVDLATERISQLDNLVGAKILSLMNARSASKILGQLDAQKVKALTQLMQTPTKTAGQ